MTFLLKEAMGNYLRELDEEDPAPFVSRLTSRLPTANSLPVKPKSTNWMLDRSSKSLKRTYEFSSHARMSDFLREVLDRETETGHYGHLDCAFPHVTITVKTHDLDDVTELDKEYARACDSIYEDVRHYDDPSDRGEYEP